MNVMRWSGPIARSIAAAVVLSYGFAWLEAQQPAPRPAVPSKPTPRTASGKPDLSGVWDHPYVPDMTKTAKDQRGHAELPYTPAGLQEWKTYDAANGDYTGSCLPHGMTRSFNAPYPIGSCRATPSSRSVRVEYLFHRPADRRAAHAERARADVDGTQSAAGTATRSSSKPRGSTAGPSSIRSAIRIRRIYGSQTFRRTDFDHMVYTITVTDPETYTKPEQRADVHPYGGWPHRILLRENNKDSRGAHQDGRRRRRSRSRIA